MSAPTLAARWSSWGPHLRSVLRIVAALIFVQAGTVKLFGFPIGMPPNGGTASFPSQVWIGGFLEVVGGALLALGLFTRAELGDIVVRNSSLASSRARSRS